MCVLKSSWVYLCVQLHRFGHDLIDRWPTWTILVFVKLRFLRNFVLNNNTTEISITLSTTFLCIYNNLQIHRFGHDLIDRWPTWTISVFVKLRFLRNFVLNNNTTEISITLSTTFLCIYNNLQITFYYFWSHFRRYFRCKHCERNEYTTEGRFDSRFASKCFISCFQYFYAKLVLDKIYNVYESYRMIYVVILELFVSEHKP